MTRRSPRFLVALGVLPLLGVCVCIFDITVALLKLPSHVPRRQASKEHTGARAIATEAMRLYIAHNMSPRTPKFCAKGDGNAWPDFRFLHLAASSPSVDFRSFSLTTQATSCAPDGPLPWHFFLPVAILRSSTKRYQSLYNRRLNTLNTNS